MSSSKTPTGRRAETSPRQLFAPEVRELADEFDITDGTLEAMTVSLYVLGFAIGPLIFASLSELHGHLVVYNFSNVVYLAFTFRCAFSTDTAVFLVLRFFAGSAAPGPMSIGGGTVADVAVQEKRGSAMALFTIGPILKPILGPIIGGFVSQYLG